MPITVDLFRNAENVERFAAGQPIFREGDEARIMYAVQEGEVEIRHGRRVLDVLGPGEVFGEMAIIDGLPRSADAVARTDCRLAPVDEKRFLFLVQQTPYFSLQMMRILAERIRTMLGTDSLKIA